MNKEQTAQLIATLSLDFPSFKKKTELESKALINLWHEMFSEDDPDHVRAAAMMFLKDNNGFAPKVADIKKTMEHLDYYINDKTPTNMILGRDRYLKLPIRTRAYIEKKERDVEERRRKADQALKDHFTPIPNNEAPMTKKEFFIAVEKLHEDFRKSGRSLSLNETIGWKREDSTSTETPQRKDTTEDRKGILFASDDYAIPF